MQIMGKRAQRKADRRWDMTREEVLKEAVVTQSEMTCIGKRQGTVVQWVALKSIFEV